MPRRNRSRAMLASAVLAVLGGSVLAATAPGEKPVSGGEIAFRRFSDVERTQGAIFVMKPDGSGVRQITHPPAGGLDDQPNWAPDGSRIVFARQPAGDNPDVQRAFWTVKPDGSEPRLISPGCSEGPPKCAPNEQKNEPIYSADGRRIAFGWAAGDVREDIDQIQFSEVYVMRADGSDPHPLTSFTTAAPYTQDTGPAAWSPDGKRLLIERRMSPVGEPAGGAALFIIDADGGGGVRQLTPWPLRAAGRADWSSDGRLIVFRTIPPGGDGPGGDIYTIRPDGRGLRQLTHFGSRFELGELGFSPDAKSIVFTKGLDSRNVFTMRTNGTHVRRLTETELSENWPDWGGGRSH